MVHEADDDIQHDESAAAQQVPWQIERDVVERLAPESDYPLTDEDKEQLAYGAWLILNGR